MLPEPFTKIARMVLLKAATLPLIPSEPPFKIRAPVDAPKLLSLETVTVAPVLIVVPPL